MRGLLRGGSGLCLLLSRSCTPRVEGFVSVHVHCFALRDKGVCKAVIKAKGEV